MLNKTFSKRLKEIKYASHKDIFKIVKDMHGEGISLNDQLMFDMNIVAEILNAYCATYDMRTLDENSNLVAINESEVLLPLNSRSSGIGEELKWLINEGYDINSHVSFEGNNENFYDYPVIQAFAFPIDIHIANWMIDKGCAKQLEIDIGDGETVADWCFDNLDICAEDLINQEFETSKICKITADLIRILLKHGCRRRQGTIISIDNNNKVSFNLPNYIY